MQALVTGAARRIGRAVALALGGAGYRVAVHYNRSRAEAEETAALLGGAPLVQGDQAREPERIVAEAAAALGGLDLLVCSAARFEKVSSEALQRPRFEAMLAANLTGPFYLMQTALPFLQGRARQHRQPGGLVRHRAGVEGLRALRRLEGGPRRPDAPAGARVGARGPRQRGGPGRGAAARPRTMRSGW